MSSTDNIINILPTTPRTPKSTKNSKKSKTSKTPNRRALAARLVGLIPVHPFLDDNDSKESKSVPLSSRRSSKDRPVVPRSRCPQRGDDSSNSSSTTFDSVETRFSQSSMLRLDKYAFMSHRLPETTKTEKLIFRKLPNKGDIVIETSGGEMIGSIDHSRDGTIRRVKNAEGKPCAIIQQKITEYACGLRPTISFRVYGDKPSTPGQKPSTRAKSASGCYLWAEIKNAGSLGGKFVMKRYSSQTNSCSADGYCAKRFGSLFSKDKCKGFNILDSEEKECAKMVSLQKNRNKGTVIAPKRDMCLMLAFCAVVDEIVEHLVI